MQGVAANLAARIEQRYERSRFAQATERSEAPLPDALSLLMRERLTGQTPPAKARAVVNLWRQWVEGRARSVLDRMPEMLSTRKRSAGSPGNCLPRSTSPISSTRGRRGTIE